MDTGDEKVPIGEDWPRPSSGSSMGLHFNPLGDALARSVFQMLHDGLMLPDGWHDLPDRP
jgi:hypothetical protein